ncbi:MAG: dephospho-CoA kinase [Agathobacter sp.]|nr:dephospho-CoA kinase [Agathobacter sp.]MBQ2283528.1 dephospho-CoA kinase [Agathobacter sp.]
MRFIGVTGGVGAGKSAILSYLEQKPRTKVMLADEIAHFLMEPGTDCYEALRKEFASEPIWQEDGHFDKEALGKMIFSDPDKRDRLNGIVHPAVKEYVRQQQKLESEKGELDLLILEAALLIEEKYNEICDELWYIYTDSNIRRLRLKESRGYSDEKIDNILASQLSEEEYRKACQFVIDNNGTFEESAAQIENALRRYAHE